MKILINYANNKYKKTQNFNTFTGKVIANFDKIYSFGPNDIDKSFYNKNKKILDIKRGNGLWLWKPYFIKKVMENSNEGDYIFYCDSGSFFIRSIDNLINSLDKDEFIWVSDIPLLENNFTKKLCFEKMKCNNDKYKFTNQIQATFIMIKCCEESKKFINKWLTLCEDYELLFPENREDLITKNEEFISHREDQSILSLLCKINDIKPHKDPSQRGRFQEWYYSDQYPYVRNKHLDTYKTIIFLHKQPYITILIIIKHIIRMYLQKLKYRKIISTFNKSEEERIEA